MNKIVMNSVVNLLNKGRPKERIDELMGEDIAKIREEKT